MSRPGLLLVIVGFLAMAVASVFYATISITEFYDPVLRTVYKVFNALSALGVLVALLGFVVMLVESDKTPSGPR